MLRKAVFRVGVGALDVDLKVEPRGTDMGSCGSAGEGDGDGDSVVLALVISLLCMGEISNKGWTWRKSSASLRSSLDPPASQLNSPLAEIWRQTHLPSILAPKRHDL